ncbi:MAG: proteasome regulatory subunit [Methanolobus sp.]|jgi:proteasome regulatory subunit|uniref:Proteasome-activating nucleotidase n=1 Tax=Methanolobus tindarius DSM 2278 TaxID=1090322 RepID=W9DQG0_METTI|nr:MULTISPECIES: proteasome-activating nucleotidase [Methanolobus]ETA67698.1 Proteasome-activating nucleotidase [Methanolobus tindarius DSM 2278]MDK2832143.1 proteasome regulatory subunit [Methanolobus sp.]MDK2939666.1 proteasome regulatory subunit [Methanolobus sp.]
MSETSDSDFEHGRYDFTSVNKADYDYVGTDNEEDFSKYLLDRMRQLESRNTLLKEQCDQIESEKRFVESQKLKYEREVRRLQAEVDRLKTVPLVVATIMDVISEEKVLVRSSTGPQFMVNVSQYLSEESLVPGAKVALNQQTLAIVEVIPTSEDPAVSAMEVIESQDVDYEDIGGLDSQIQELIESVELPLTKPEAFQRIGITPPKGVLLYGEPGTGKTLLAKAVAHRTEATYIRVVGSELIQKYIGDGSKLVRELFEMARKKSPSIIFIDELDAIASRRLNDTNGADREVQRTLMQLLAEMDGFDNRGDVRIIAATNRLDVLDPAILRPGRFDRIVNVPMPDEEARANIFRIHTRFMSVADDLDYRKLAKLTEKASGADLNAIAMEAGMLAVRLDKKTITMDDFLESVQKVMSKKETEKEVLPEGMFI